MLVYHSVPPIYNCGMSEHPTHIGKLFAAELQFRLASAVHLATTLNIQPLDLPHEWTHGKHRVRYNEIALREDQADFAAHTLHQSASFLMAVAVRDAMVAAISDPKNDPNADIRGAFQVARLIRNAFAHSPFDPVWSIDPDCRDQVFAVTDVISLDTTGLQGVQFDWRHYGGPLALLRLCHFVRFEILKDPGKRPSEREVPPPGRRYYQQGNLIFREVKAGDLPR